MQVSLLPLKRALCTSYEGDKVGLWFCFDDFLERKGSGRRKERRRNELKGTKIVFPWQERGRASDTQGAAPPLASTSCLLRRSGVLPFGRVTPQRELVPCLPCCTLCLVTHAFLPPSRVRQLSGCFGSPRGTQARRAGAGCELVVQAQVPKWSEHRASLPLGPCISGLVHAYALAITLAASPEPPATGVRLTAFAQSDSCGRGDTQTLPVITTLPQLADASGGPRCASVRVSGGGSSSSTHSEAMLSHRPTSWPHTQGVHFTCSSNHMPCPSGRVRRHEIGASGLTTSHGGARVGLRWQPLTRTRRNNKHPTHTDWSGCNRWRVWAKFEQVYRVPVLSA